MRRKKVILALVAITTAIILSACGGTDEADPVEEENQVDESTPNEEDSQNEEGAEQEHSETDHSDMDHSGSSEVPTGLKEEENPKYEVGSKAIITEAHMEGMEEAEATIVGAYDTYVYTISYTPTTGGERITDHKWVIHEEFPEIGDEPLEPGEEAVTDASHMTGMEGATVEIDSVEETTVYMIDFTPTTGGEEVTNHKWVTESELSPIQE
ncbi:YdhK family protein [Aquibacillus sediminis]|uniref:YdhK family protein n=1 Tax=Aquibacillus sediminis TaxID=2574734 RepID=UPI001108FAD5|nr:YdhK family protein [Aquibacillus sediminis]